MKKSKFLQNSKDVLSRSFNPSKCKTSLRLAGSRVKLLRNKKEVQVKQMKREIAHLLESGQDQTARIRVEHVIREEKMMAAYDLIEIYCELTVARLPIIESQKNCPIDLKEAIASLIFSSPRCGDVPELLDVRKHFTSKYGKDFTTAAIELRPNCGVSRLLVEKLSAIAPDGQTKIQILNAIAEEHDIKWDPKSFEERDSVPPNDVLSGPSTFVNESKVSVEQPHIVAPDAQVAPLKLSQQDHGTPLGKEQLSAAQISSINATFPPEARPAGGERAQMFQDNSNTIPEDKRRWNIEFKDATSAAQAAAESAELASMAARAAAELSRGRIARQHSSESNESDAYFSYNEAPQRYANSKLPGKQFSEESVDRSSKVDEVKPIDTKTTGRFREDGRVETKEYNLKSKASLTDGDSFGCGVPAVDDYSQKNSFKEVSRGEMNMEESSFKNKVQSEIGWPEESENFGEERFGKQSSVNSSPSHSCISDDVNIFSNSAEQHFDYDGGHVRFPGINEESIHRESAPTNSNDPAAVFFDKYDSYNELHGFDTGPVYDEPESELHLQSQGQKSPDHLSKHTDSWSPRFGSSYVTNPTSSSPFLTRKSSSPDFTKNLKSVYGPEIDNSRPVIFDDSEGPSSEGDEDMNMSKHTRMKDSADLLGEANQSGQSFGSYLKDTREKSNGSPVKEKESSGFNRIQLSLISDDELKPEEMHRERSQGKESEADPPGKFSIGTSSAANQPALEPEESILQSNDIGYQPSTEREDGLNLGKLTGGLRHKGYNRPPYLVNSMDVPSSLKSGTEKSTATVTRSTAPPAVESPRMSPMSGVKRSITPPYLHSELGSDSSEEEESPQKSSGHRQYTLASGEGVETKLNLGASVSVFRSDDSDLDDDPPKETLTRKSYMQSGISRRTKPSSSSSGMSYSKIQLRSEAPESDGRMDGRPPASYISETPNKSESRRNSSNLENAEKLTPEEFPSKPAKSNFWGPPVQFNSEKETPVMMQEPRVHRSSETHDSDVDIKRKPTKSPSPEAKQQFQSSRVNFSRYGNSEQPSSSAEVASEHTKSSLWGAPEKSNYVKATSVMMQESKITEKSSTVEGQPTFQPKTETMASHGTSKEGTLNNTSSNKDDNAKKASHVHPKLPDYDTLIQSLRMNRS